MKPIRDWTFSGITLATMGVLSANESQVTIGFTNKRGDDVAFYNNLRERAFGTSPTDYEVLTAAVYESLKIHRVARLVKVA